MPEILGKIDFVGAESNAFQFQSSSLFIWSAEGIAGSKTTVGKYHTVAWSPGAIGIGMERVAHSSRVAGIQNIRN